jgi:hypothetical protein
VAGTVTVGGTVDIGADTTGVDTMGTATTTPDITAGMAAGATSPVDIIRGGCFRFPFLTRTMGDITVQTTDMDMDRVTAMDTD